MEENEDEELDIDLSIKNLETLKLEGNKLYHDDSYSLAKDKFNEANKLIDKLLEYDLDEKQVKEINQLHIQMLSNESLCLYKLKNYDESSQLELQIKEINPDWDKPYARLYRNYIIQGKIDEALEMGKNLLNFDKSVLKKYGELINEINARINQENANENESNNNCICY